MDTPTPITPAGWYDDGHGQLRWWDGSRWTEHTAPLAPRQPVRQEPAPRSRPAPADLVAVPRSRLVWILPLAMVVAALVGGLLGAVTANSISDTDPVEEAYATFLRAERTRDCALLQQVTTPSFREDLVDDYVEGFTCEKWLARPSARRSDITWAMRIGPFGMLIAREQYIGSGSGSTSVTYYASKQDGRWKLDDREDGSDF